MSAEPVDGPWELPHGWRWERLGIQLANGAQTYDPMRLRDEVVELYSVPSFESGQPEVIAASAIGSTKQFVAPGDVLLCKINPRINRAWVVGAATGLRQIASTEWIRFHPSGDVQAQYLQRFLSTERVRSFLAMNVSGVGGSLMRVKGSTVAPLPFPIPPPDVQQRIVDRIDALFSEIEEGEQALAGAREGVETYRKALLKAAVTGELTADWRKANPPTGTGQDHLRRILADRRARWEANPKNRNKTYVEPATPNTDDLPTIPVEWAWASVEAVGEVQLGRQRAPQHHVGDDMRPYLRVANVLEARLDLRDVKQMNFTPQEYEIFALRSGDVLLNEGQAPDLIGRPAVYREKIDGCCFQKTLLRFRASGFVDPEFALIVFRQYMRSGRFKREARITTNIGHLTQVRFAPMEFPIPTLAEQNKIVSIVEMGEQGAAELPLAVDEVSELRQSILAAAFRGELTS